MSDYKQIQRQMKGPDEFQVKVMTWLDHMIKYKQVMFGIAGAAVLIALGTWGFKSFLESRSMKRRVAVADVDVLYQQELEAQTKARESLQKELDLISAQGEMPEADAAKKAEVAAKVAELQARIKAIKADHAGSRDKYKQAYNEHKKHPEGWLAGLRYASFLVKENKLDESKAVLADVLKASKDHSFFQVQGGLLYLGVLEDLKDYDTALAEVDKLVKAVPGELKAKLLLTKGRLQMAKQQGAEAKQTLDSVIKDYSTSPEAERARGMKAIIN